MNEMTVDKRELKKGDKVVMHTCMEAPHHHGVIWTCRTDEFVRFPETRDYGEVFLEGYSGSFATEYLQLVDLSDYEQQVKELSSQRHAEYAGELRKQVKELEKYKKGCEVYRDALNQQLPLYHELKHQAQKMKEALQHYAESEFFTGSGTDTLDVGDLARSILAEMEDKP